MVGSRKRELLLRTGAVVAAAVVFIMGYARGGNAENEIAGSNACYSITTYDLPADLKFEVSGLAVLPDGKLAVAIRKGEIWILDHPEAEPADLDKVGFRRFASGLHEPLGLSFHAGALYASQRSEVTRIRDTDGNGEADEYLTAAKGWGVSGNYHEYTYGPVFDRRGRMWLTLNSTLGEKWTGAGPDAADTPWRGWAMAMAPGGRMLPMAAGLRSPCGLGLNAEGDVFATDQQGNWFGTNPLLHLREGAFYGHGDSLPDMKRPGAPVRHPGKLPEGITAAEAIHRVPGYAPPAVWFPYVKMGQSTTGIVCDTTGGKFGPFGGQLFVGEFVLAGINRVFLENVDGEYQGACFPFLSGFQSAVLQMAFLADGAMVVGETNRGWNSYGSRSFGLQRVKWNGRKPFEILKIEAMKEGFRFTFTEKLNARTVGGQPEFAIESYTYLYHSKYGSDEVDKQPVKVEAVTVASDGLALEIQCAGLREGYVHEFHLPALKSESGLPLVHGDGFYTLNRRPRG